MVSFIATKTKIQFGPKNQLDFDKQRFELDQLDLNYDNTI